MNTRKAHIEKLSQYRRSVDALFDLSAPTPAELRLCFREIWWAATELYAELVRWIIAVDRDQTLEVDADQLEWNVSATQFGVLQEIDQRARLTSHLQNLTAWSAMSKHSMAQLAGFNSKEDYLNSLTLHLPEIYHETWHIEEEIAELIRDGENFPDVVIDISFKHALQNHLRFVFPTLMWLSEPTCWNEE